MAVFPGGMTGGNVKKPPVRRPGGAGQQFTTGFQPADSTRGQTRPLGDRPVPTFRPQGGNVPSGGPGSRRWEGGTPGQGTRRVNLARGSGRRFRFRRRPQQPTRRQGEGVTEAERRFRAKNKARQAEVSAEARRYPQARAEARRRAQRRYFKRFGGGRRPSGGPGSRRWEGGAGGSRRVPIRDQGRVDLGARYRDKGYVGGNMADSRQPQGNVSRTRLKFFRRPQGG